MQHQNKKPISPFSIKNIFYDKMDLMLFYFDVAKYPTFSQRFKRSWTLQSQRYL